MKNKNYIFIVFCAVLVIIAIQVAIGFAIYSSFPDWPSRGQFGDVFGTVNALFSGLAFAGLIYAILLQREDLVLQRKELELTRTELRRSATAQEQSEIALKAQAEATSQSAKLSAINFLLGHYQEELNRMSGIIIPNIDPRFTRKQVLVEREQKLLEMLDSLFNEISEKGNNNEV